MAYVEPSSVTTGAVITATRWNQDVVDNTLALYNSPGALYRPVNSVSAIQAENTLIPFTGFLAEIYNNGVTEDNVNYTLTAQTAGVYVIFCSGEFASTTSANNGTLYVQSNDGQIIEARTFQHPAVGGGYIASMSILGFKKLGVGDYIQFYVRQNLISSLVFTTATLGMHWIGSGD